ncbi:saccharopine dehydrogenase (NADP+, L-glutamate-forming) [Friedmanniomyces endolithicus]|nr:saccharopine dehydrogenase (NADP+, L-glutamate-forming) [Friedmanniomyces endolithicus]
MPAQRQPIPADWAAYERGGRQHSHDSGLSHNQVHFDEESQQEHNGENESHLRLPSDQQQELRRRRSSMAMRVNALRHAGGVNSLENFTRSWQRAAGFYEVTPIRQSFVTGSIPEAQTLIRGTLRYQGNPAFVQTLRDLGLLSEDKHDFMQNPDATWKESFAKIVGSSSSSDTDLVWAVSSKTKFADNDEKERILAGLRWVGLFSDDKIGSGGNPLDCLCGSLEKKMQYEKGERDFVMLQHKFGIEWADGRHETRTSTLCEYGEPEGSGGYSAMAKLVGVPCAVAVQMVLSGEIKDKGILAPVTPELAEPIRVKLQKDYGIELIEKTLA